MRGQRETKTCKYCGKSFSILVSQTHGRRGTYCSKDCKHRGMSNTPESFWNRVNKGNPSECWNWIGSIGKHGYGKVSWNGKDCRAHRIAFELTNGFIDPELEVMHSCDHKPCCNPGHLSQGTTLDNAKDRNAKGRHVHGERQSSAVLTELQVTEIFKLCQTQSQYKVAERFNVSQSTVGAIARGKAWKHLGLRGDL